jgi:predicted dehydrogenase
MKIRVAILGAGYIGEIHAKAVESQPNAELVAVVEPIEEKARGFALRHSIAGIYSSLDVLLNDHAADAVIIATPNYLHAPQAISSLEAGLHVLIEKPMAANLEEAKRMEQASHASPGTLMIGHCWRYDTEVNWLRRQVLANNLGNVIRTKGYGIHENWGPAGWFTQKELAGGGALMDMGIHPIDTARYLLGDPEPLSVYASIGTFYGNYDVDDTGMLMISWKGGAVSSIEFGWWQPFSDGPEAATRLYGTKGYGSVFPTRLVLPIGQTDQVKVVEDGFVYPREEHCEQSMYDRQMAHFLSCITEHTTPCSSLAVGMTNMKILAAAYQSSGTGKAVGLGTP